MTLSIVQMVRTAAHMQIRHQVTPAEPCLPRMVTLGRKGQDTDTPAGPQSPCQHWRKPRATCPVPQATVPQAAGRPSVGKGQLASARPGPRSCCPQLPGSPHLQSPPPGHVRKVLNSLLVLPPEAEDVDRTQVASLPP